MMFRSVLVTLAALAGVAHGDTVEVRSREVCVCGAVVWISADPTNAFLFVPLSFLVSR